MAMIVLDTPKKRVARSPEKPSSDTKSTSSWRSQQTMSPENLSQSLLDYDNSTDQVEECDPFDPDDYLSYAESSEQNLKIV